jgi:hypothetical protein
MDSTAETGTRIPAAMSGVFAVMSGVRRRNIWSSFFLVSGPGQSLRKPVRGPTAVQVFRKTWEQFQVSFSRQCPPVLGYRKTGDSPYTIRL